MDPAVSRLLSLLDALLMSSLALALAALLIHHGAPHSSLAVFWLLVLLAAAVTCLTGLSLAHNAAAELSPSARRGLYLAAFAFATLAWVLSLLLILVALVACIFLPDLLQVVAAVGDPQKLQPRLLGA